MSATAKKDHHTIVASEPLGPEALDALKAELTAALDAASGDIAIDLTEAPGIDGACLSAVLRAACSLSSGRTLSVIAGPDLTRAFAEWRLDTIVGLIESSPDPVVETPEKE